MKISGKGIKIFAARQKTGLLLSGFRGSPEVYFLDRKLFQFFGDSVGNALHFFCRQRHFRFVEIHVLFLDDWNEVDMCVRHFQTDDCHTDTLAFNGFLHCFCHAACKKVE